MAITFNHNDQVYVKDGKLGIGTASPGNLIHIHSSSSGFSGSYDSRYKSIVEANGEAYYATYVPDNSYSGIRFNNTSGLRGFIDYYHGTQGDALVYSATNHHRFLTNGVERVRLIQNGNVGIGTTSPADKLHVEGNITLSDPSPEITLQTGATHYNWQLAAQENVNAAFEISVGSQDADASNDTWSPKMVVLQSGNVGIGTTSPKSQLHIYESNTGGIGGELRLDNNGLAVANKTRILFSDAGGNSASFDRAAIVVETENSPYNGQFQFQTGFGTLTTKMIISGAGNVGIGTTSPSTRLYVDGGESTFNRGNSDGTIATFRGKNAEQAVIGTLNSWFDSNVGIGTTSPVNAGGNAKWLTLNSVSGSSYSGGIAYTINDTVKAYHYVEDGYLRHQGQSGVGHRFTVNAGTQAMLINTSGNVGIGTTSPDHKLTVYTDATSGVELVGQDGGNQNSDSSKIIFNGHAQDNGPFIQAINTSAYGIKRLGFFANRTATDYTTLPTESMSITNTGNVGIGTTSPRSRLDVYGDIYQEWSDDWNFVGQVYQTGSQYRNGIATNSASRTTQIEARSAGTDGEITFLVGTSEVARMIHGGNVGIGTTSPENKLHLLTSTTDATQQLLIQNGSTGDAAIKFNISGETYSVGIDNSDSNKFKISDGNLGTNDRIVIDSAGNVGIGITSPATDLSLGNATHTSPDDTDRILNWYASTGGDEISNSSHYITVGQNSSNTSQPKSVGLALFNSNTANNTYSPAITFGGLSTSGDYMTGAGAISTQLIANADDNNFRGGDLTFYTSGTTSATRGLNEKMRITSGGNVGIGTTSPETKLQVNGAVYSMIGLYSDHTYSSNRNWRIVTNSFGAGNWGGLAIKTSNSAGSTPNTTRFGIDYLGNVGIGTTSPGAKLHVEGTTKITGDTTLGTTSSAFLQMLRAGANYIAASNASGELRFRTGGSSDRMTIASNGNVGIGNTSPNAKLDIISTASGSEGLRVDGESGGFAFVVKAGSDYTSHIRAGATIGVNYFTTPPSNGLIVEGKVGIGTTVPVSNLHSAQSTGTVNELYITQQKTYGVGTGTAERAALVLGISENGIAFADRKFAVIETGSESEQSSANSFMAFSTRVGGGVNERMRITSGGNVGIGTTSPATKLYVDGGESTFNRGNSDGAIARFRGSNAEKAVIGTVDSWFASNVGIGTTSPAEKLEVSSSGNVYAKVTTTTTGGSNAGIKFLSSGAREWGIFTDGNLRFYDFSGSSERMRIDTSGNVGIGTTSPLTKLHVEGGVTINTGNGASTFNDLNIGGVAGWSNSEAHRINFVYGNGTSDIFQTIESYYGGANEGKMRFRNFYTNNPQTGILMTIHSNGNVGIGTDSPDQNLQIHESTSSGAYLKVTNSATGEGGGNGSLFGISSNEEALVWNYENTATRFSTNGTERMRITAGGNLGIGLTDPAAKLEVLSSHHVRSAANVSHKLRIEARDTYFDDSDSAGIWISDGGSTGDFSGQGSHLIIEGRKNSSRHIYFKVGDTTSPQHIMKADGNVGIGTTSPTYKLDVNGGIRTSSVTGPGVLDLVAPTSFLRFQANANNIFYDAGGNHYFRTASGASTSMIVTSAGNVGIGTTSPSDKLTVAGVIKSIGGTNNGKFAQIYVNDSFAYYTTNASVIYMSSELQVNSGRIGSYDEDLSLETSGTTRITVSNSNGNVGIGTTAPQQALHIKGATNALMMLEGDNDNGIAGCYYKSEDTDDTMNRTKGFFGFTGNNIYGNGYFTMWLDNANDDGQVTASEERFRWERDGDFHADGDVIAYSTTTPSDIRLKTDVETIQSASEKVSKLRGVEYTWSKGKLAGQREIGLIAQEVEAVVPEVVKEKELPLWDDSGESYKTVDYEKLVALLIESNKELQARVEQLENKLDGFTK